MPCIVTYRDRGALRHITVDTPNTWVALQTAHDHVGAAMSARPARPGESLPAATLTPRGAAVVPIRADVPDVRQWVDTQPVYQQQPADSSAHPTDGAGADEVSTMQMLVYVLLSAAMATAAAVLVFADDLVDAAIRMFGGEA